MDGNAKTSSKLKDRLARMFRRNSCNSTSATSVTLSSGSTSCRTLLSDIARNPSRSLSTLDHRKVHVGATTSAVTARVSIDCGVCRPNRDNFVLPKSNPIQVQPLPLRSGIKEGRVSRNGVVSNGNTGTGTSAGTGECSARTCPPVSQSSSVKPLASNSYRIYYSLNKSGKTKIKKKLCNNGYGFSESASSSMESDVGYGIFSSEDEGGGPKAETETSTFFSSKSFSSDSSEFYSKPIQNASVKKKRSNKTKQRRRRVSSCQNCNIKEGFQPLVSVTSKEKKEKSERVKKGFAVVKKSNDPYADFRNSMVEMIIERQIFGAEDLEKLLHSYLSLNSPRHHPVILQAFSDIWVVLFGN